MIARNLGAAAFALGLICAPPALAGGDPSGGGASVQTGAPGPIGITMPPVDGRGAYVTQIGQGDVARITQTTPNASASVYQDGERNEATVSQTGTGSAYADVRQTGDRNSALVAQDGTGQNVLYLSQTGYQNIAAAGQTANGAMHNGAILTQTGQYNEMALAQDGSDNLAALTQDGAGNAMTAAQTGDGNRLVWTQQGNNLPNLGVTQSGNQAIQITQTGQGN